MNYEVLKVEDERTEYASFVVHVKAEATGKELRVYLNERIGAEASAGVSFIYRGLKPIKGGRGHKYHGVEWFEE